MSGRNFLPPAPSRLDYPLLSKSIASSYTKSPINRTCKRRGEKELVWKKVSTRNFIALAWGKRQIICWPEIFRFKYLTYTWCEYLVCLQSLARPKWLHSLGRFCERCLRQKYIKLYLMEMLFIFTFHGASSLFTVLCGIQCSHLFSLRLLSVAFLVHFTLQKLGHTKLYFGHFGRIRKGPNTRYPGPKLWPVHDKSHDCNQDQDWFYHSL